MSLCHCPGCKNVVERNSIMCPVCGRSWTQMAIMRVLRWCVLAAMLVLVVVTFVRRH